MPYPLGHGGTQLWAPTAFRVGATSASHARLPEVFPSACRVRESLELMDNVGRKKARFRRGSNPRPLACEASVITTTLRNRSMSRP
jgi:hypothetical protein